MSPTPTAGQLQFAFTDVQAEIRFVAAAAKSLLDPSAEIVLKQYRSLLDSIQTSRASGLLAIDSSEPLRTVPSKGRYDKGKGAPAFAEISSVWEITCIPEQKRSIPPRRFVVSGAASTLVTIFEGQPSAPGDLLASWKMELGAPGAPGCFFHSHIQSHIPVPRLPILPAFPMSVVEFTLGELFQEHWEQLAARETPEQTKWRVLQSQRLDAFCAWQRKELAETTGSPWITLKRAMPPTELFITT
jgi:hypothetical protein